LQLTVAVDYFAEQPSRCNLAYAKAVLINHSHSTLKVEIPQTLKDDYMNLNYTPIALSSFQNLFLSVLLSSDEKFTQQELSETIGITSKIRNSCAYDSTVIFIPLIKPFIATFKYSNDKRSVSNLYQCAAFAAFSNF
jgi:hypothetical protein